MLLRVNFGLPGENLRLVIKNCEKIFGVEELSSCRNLATSSLKVKPDNFM